MKLVLLATDRASYGNLAQLITRGRRQAEKGSYALTRDDVAALAGGLLALWVPPGRPCAPVGKPSTAREIGLTRDRRALGRRRRFPDRAWIAVELFARAGDRARLARCGALVARERAAAGRRRRRPHARARAARAAGHADRDPPEHAARRLRLRALPQRRAAPALARAARDDLSAGAARRDASRSRERCTLFARRAALRVSRGDRAAGRDAGVASARADRSGARSPLSRTAFQPTSASWSSTSSR